MKYGIIVNGKVTEPTEIPAQGHGDPVAWLERYRFKGEWVEVPNHSVPGTKKNENGTFTAPPSVEATAAPQSNTALILERLTAISEKVDAVTGKVDKVEAKVDALAGPE